MRTNPLFDFSHLTAAERIQLAQDLWDSLGPAEVDSAVPLTEAQQAELERRLAELERDPDAGMPWHRAMAEIEAGLTQRRQDRRGS